MSQSPKAVSPDLPVVIYRTANPTAAHMLKALLGDYGIQSRVVGDISLVAGTEFGLRTASIAVTVAAAQAHLASGIAAAYQRHVHRTGHALEDTDHFPIAWEDWPSCPQCNRRRETQCPVCRSASTQFELADPGPLASESVMVLCDVCDEPFVPQFRRTCVWCNYQNPDGNDDREPVIATSLDQAGALVGIGLAASFLAALAWLWYTFGG